VRLSISGIGILVGRAAKGPSNGVMMFKRVYSIPLRSLALGVWVARFFLPIVGLSGICYGCRFPLALNGEVDGYSLKSCEADYPYLVRTRSRLTRVVQLAVLIFKISPGKRFLLKSLCAFRAFHVCDISCTVAELMPVIDPQYILDALALTEQARCLHTTQCLYSGSAGRKKLLWYGPVPQSGVMIAAVMWPTER